MIHSARRLAPLVAAVVLLPLCTALTSGDDARTSNPNVKVWAHLSRQMFKPGETGEITITLSAAEGYHINANPAVEVKLDDPRLVILKGVPTQAIDKSTGYLSSRSPVRQIFYVPSTTSAGFHVLKGTVTYFYCSDSEGWCRRYRQPISLSFTLSK